MARVSSLHRIDIDASALSNRKDSFDCEWIVTNGLGGFAAGTVGGVNTRRYHGWLVAADPPPNARWVLLASLDEFVTSTAGTFPLSAHAYLPDVVHPDGDRSLVAFGLVSGRPVWRFRHRDVEIERTVWMPRGENRTYIRYTCVSGGPVQLELRPLVAHRWFHSLRLADGRQIRVEATQAGHMRVHGEGPPFSIGGEAFGATISSAWYWGFRLAKELERGFDSQEDLFCPGTLVAALNPGQPVTLAAWAGDLPPSDPELSLQAFDSRIGGLVVDAHSDLEAHLRVAADTFLVHRGERVPSARAVASNTVIAGYPWFGDWGRDTMIALPGLCLSTGRFEVAKQILLAYARHIDQGMLPNVWPDAGEQPSYTSVDSALLFLRALERYVAATGDLDMFEVLATGVLEIIEWYGRGTRHGIRVDPVDGLVAAGAPGLQLTWMDAKHGDRVFTPRRGKPVEINGLWCAGLAFAVDGLRRIGWDTQDLSARADQARRSFADRFWNPATGCLFDVVDGPDGDDPAIRPNQVLALAVDPPLLTDECVRSALDVVARELATPVGLRSLAPSDAKYRERYEGGPFERDAAYHQGPVWSWLLGPYVEARLRAGTPAAHLHPHLEAMSVHLHEGCVGTVSEIFQPEPPFAPDGAFAQAWGVGEWLRVVQMLERGWA